MALNIEEKPIEDNSIFSKEDFPFNPITGTDYNGAGIIQINIENQSDYFLPSESWIQIDGEFKKSDGNRYNVNEMASLTNNGILHCFSNIKYQLSGNEIESVNNPGQATTMMGLLNYDKNYPGLGQCWAQDTTTTAAVENTGFIKRKNFLLTSNPIGTFSFNIDLKHIFGFAVDYEKVVYGLRHSLQFNRKASDNDAIFRGAAEALNGKVEIKKITWWMPKVIPSQVESFRLGKLIDKDTTIEAGFRVRQCSTVQLPPTTTNTWNLGVKTEKPRFVIVSFQTAKDDNQTENVSVFDHCQVTSMKIILNSTEYPAIDINSDFNKHEFAGWYKRMAEFKQSFHGIDQIVSSSGIDADEFKSLFPLYVFDVSKQVEKLQTSVVDISVKMTFNANVNANTHAFALVISDRKLRFKAEGKRMSVLF